VKAVPNLPASFRLFLLIFRLVFVVMVMSGAGWAQSGGTTLYAVGNDIWSIHAGTGVATRLFDITASEVAGWGASDRMNALALDPIRHQLIFAHATSRSLYTYSLGSGVFSSLGSLDVVLGGYAHLGSYTMDSGATFYQGKYYAALETVPPAPWTWTPGAPSAFLAEVNLNPAGTAIASASIYGGTMAAPTSGWGYPLGFNDFGDLTVHPGTGELWGYTYVDHPGDANFLEGFWRGNLSTPGVGVTVVSQTLSAWSQIAYDPGADVLYAVPESASGGGYSLYVIDKVTGATLHSLPIVGYSDSSGMLADLAVIPEPATVAVWAAAGCLVYGWWRRRTRRPSRG